MDILKKITEYKLSFVAEREKEISLEQIKKLASLAHEPRGFQAAIDRKNSNNQFAIIAEVKKASPSKGIIREDFNPANIATAYENAGAACISVLTDEKFFQGADDYLTIIRHSTNIPIIRKDFFLKPYQVYEARAIGADAILLIMSCLNDEEAAELEKVAIDLGLDVLVEVHDEAELERALKLKTSLVGVNNRNLKTFEISLETSKKLAKLIPDNYTKVCESGIFTNQHLQEMKPFGYNCFLVGESLMREHDVEAALTKLLTNQ